MISLGRIGFYFFKKFSIFSNVISVMQTCFVVANSMATVSKIHTFKKKLGLKLFLNDLPYNTVNTNYKLKHYLQIIRFRSIVLNNTYFPYAFHGTYPLRTASVWLQCFGDGESFLLGIGNAYRIPVIGIGYLFRAD